MVVLVVAVAGRPVVVPPISVGRAALGVQSGRGGRRRGGRCCNGRRRRSRRVWNGKVRLEGAQGGVVDVRGEARGRGRKVRLEAVGGGRGG